MLEYTLSWNLNACDDLNRCMYLTKNMLAGDTVVLTVLWTKASFHCSIFKSRRFNKHNVLWQARFLNSVDCSRTCILTIRLILSTWSAQWLWHNIYPFTNEGYLTRTKWDINLCVFTYWYHKTECLTEIQDHWNNHMMLSKQIKMRV